MGTYPQSTVIRRTLGVLASCCILLAWRVPEAMAWDCVDLPPNVTRSGNDFTVVPTGSDDTPSVQLTVDCAAELSSSSVFLGPGQFRLTQIVAEGWVDGYLGGAGADFGLAGAGNPPYAEHDRDLAQYTYVDALGPGSVPIYPPDCNPPTFPSYDPWAPSWDPDDPDCHGFPPTEGEPYPPGTATFLVFKDVTNVEVAQLTFEITVDEAAQWHRAIHGFEETAIVDYIMLVTGQPVGGASAPGVWVHDVMFKSQFFNPAHSEPFNVRIGLAMDGIMVTPGVEVPGDAGMVTSMVRRGVDTVTNCAFDGPAIGSESAGQVGGGVTWADNSFQNGLFGILLWDHADAFFDVSNNAFDEVVWAINAWQRRGAPAGLRPGENPRIPGFRRPDVPSSAYIFGNTIVDAWGAGIDGFDAGRSWWLPYEAGIAFAGSGNIVIEASHNTIWTLGGDAGIRLRGVTGGAITGNTVEGTIDRPIELSSTDGVLVADNLVSGSGDWFAVSIDGNNNSVLGNTTIGYSHAVLYVGPGTEGNQLGSSNRGVVIDAGANIVAEHDVDDCPERTQIVTGTSGSDTLVGDSGDQCLVGYDGDDHIDGGGGDDVIIGGRGDDELFGGGGHDAVVSESGDDVLTGGAGDDVLGGGPDDETLVDADGDNTLAGGGGADSFNGIGVPASLTVFDSDQVDIPVTFGFDGVYEVVGHGVAPAHAIDGVVRYGELPIHPIDVAEGAVLVRVDLFAEVPDRNHNVDMVVYNSAFEVVAERSSPTASEQLDLWLPQDTRYYVGVDPSALNGGEAPYALHWWIVPAENTTLIVPGPMAVTTGTSDVVEVTWPDDLEPSGYLGVLDHVRRPLLDGAEAELGGADGELLGRTVLELCAECGPPSCGNGEVDPDEECESNADCGPVDLCNEACQCEPPPDVIPPTVALSSPVTDPTNVSPIPVTASFSEHVTGLELSDIGVGNGTAGNLTGSHKVYEFEVIPTDEGMVTVDIGAGAAFDAAGNPNVPATQLTIVYDVTGPIAVLSSPDIVSPHPTDGEGVTGFATWGGTTTSLSDYTRTFGNIVDWYVMMVGGNAANIGSMRRITQVDHQPQGWTLHWSTALSVAVSSGDEYLLGSPSTLSTVRMEVAFLGFDIGGYQPVTGFDLSDILVLGGEASDLQPLLLLPGGPAVFTFDVTPVSEGGMVFIEIAEGAAFDPAGNGSSMLPEGWFNFVHEGDPPTVTLSSSVSDPTDADPIPMTATFNEAVTGFALYNVLVGNGTASNLQGGPAVFTFDVTPTANGLVTVDIPALIAFDSTEMWNEAAQQFSITYQSSAPTVVLTSPDVDATPPDGGPPTGTAASSGSIRSLIDSSRSFAGLVGWYVTLTTGAPVNIGEIRRIIGSGGGHLEWLYALSSPTAAGDGYALLPTSNTNPLAFLATFSEPVTGLELSEIVVVNGSPANLTGGPTKFRFDVAPVDDGLVTVDIGAGAVVDSAGKPNEAAATFNVVYDDTAPITIIDPRFATTDGEPLWGTATGGSTTSLVDATRTFSGVDTLWLVLITGGTPQNIGEVRMLTSVWAGTLQWSAANPLPQPVANGDTYQLMMRRTDNPVTMTVTFTEAPSYLGEPMTGFEQSDVVVGNGVTSNFAGGPWQYMFDLTPNSEGVVWVEVPQNVAVDPAGNGNQGAERNYFYWVDTSGGGSSTAAATP